MNKGIYRVIILTILSCKSNSIAQDKKEVKTEKTKVDTSKTGKPKIEIPGFGDPRDNEIANTQMEVRPEPGTIHLVGSVIKFYSETEVCGKPFKGAISIKVDKILKSGSGIVNIISSGQEITFGFLKGNVEDFKTLQQKFTKDQEVFFIVRESLCPDMNETVYEIIRFSIQ